MAGFTGSQALIGKVVGLVVLVSLMAGLAPTIVTQLGLLNATGLPGATLFNDGGVAPIVLGYGIVAAAIGAIATLFARKVF